MRFRSPVPTPRHAASADRRHGTTQERMPPGRTRTAGALLAATALCGCGSSTDPRTAADGTSAYLQGKLAYHGCTEQTAVIGLPASALPPGFAYLVPMAGVDAGFAAIEVSGSRCTADIDGAEAREVLAFALASVPKAYQSEGVANYAIAFGGYSNRPQSIAQYAAWGLGGVVALADVDFQLTITAAGNVGSVTATNAAGTLKTTVNGSGPRLVPEPGGGHTRAFFIRNAALVGALDAIYTEQTGQYATGTVMQSGSGPVPLPGSPALGTQAFNYSIDILSPRL